jgi:hypothetical protein
MLTRKSVLILLLSAAILTSGLSLSHVFATNTTAQLTPAYQNIAVHQTATVTFHVQNVENLYGYQVAIVFDPTILEVIDADSTKPGVQVNLSTFLQADFVQQNSADNGAGAIVCVISQLAPSAPVNGSGDLFTITFRGKAQGVSNVSFTDLKLAQASGMEISATRHDGQIGVGSVTQPTATPTSTPTPTSTTFPTTPVRVIHCTLLPDGSALVCKRLPKSMLSQTPAIFELDSDSSSLEVLLLRRRHSQHSPAPRSMWYSVATRSTRSRGAMAPRSKPSL